MNSRLEIMDTTLRDGEQTSGVSYLPTEKLSIAKFLLEKLKVSRIEVASAHVSEGEFEAVSKIAHWAKTKGYSRQIEVLGFVDKNRSVDWVFESGAKVMNLLCKGSLNHLTHQLKKTPQEHISNIRKVIHYAKTKNLDINVYLEDWSNGMKNSKAYVFQMVSELVKLPVQRILLPDTLGILDPEKTYAFCKEIIEKFPETHFDFHAHNDYDLAVANTMAAVKAGVKGVHVTVNGLGERTGNAPLAGTVVALRDHLNVETSILENKIYLAGKLVETFSGIRIPANKPIIGDNVFTQTAGIHADGDQKKKLYYNDLLPERFGRLRKYALGKTSGRANIAKNLEEFGISLNRDELQLVTQKVIEFGDKKKTVSPEDLPYIISDVLHGSVIQEKVKIENFTLSLAKNLKPLALLKINIQGVIYEENAVGDGQFDAFMNALKKIYKNQDIVFPELIDYQVNIPPGGKTDALVETQITWNYNDKELKTRGLDSDQTIAAIEATKRVLNLIASNFNKTEKN